MSTTRTPTPVAFDRSRSIPHLMRAAFSHFIARANPARASGDPTQVCRTLFPADEVSMLVTRATVLPGTTTSSGWASELAEAAGLSFVTSLAPDSAASGLIARGLTVPLLANGELRAPHRPNGPVASPWVAEGDPIPLRALSFDMIEGGTPKKIGVLTVHTHEVARRPSAQAIFETSLREDAAVSLDSAYFSTDAGSSSAIAGLLYGVTPTLSTGGLGATGAIEDLTALATAVGTSGSGEVVFVTGPGRRAAIATMLPNLVHPVLASAAVPEDRVIAVDPRSVLHGVGDAEITTSIDALAHMADDPDPIVSGTPTTAAPVRSMYQTACVATRMLLDVLFVKRRAGAAAFVDEIVSW